MLLIGHILGKTKGTAAAFPNFKMSVLKQYNLYKKNLLIATLLQAGQWWYFIDSLIL